MRLTLNSILYYFCLSKLHVASFFFFKLSPPWLHSDEMVAPQSSRGERIPGNTQDPSFTDSSELTG